MATAAMPKLGSAMPGPPKYWPPPAVEGGPSNITGRRSHTIIADALDAANWQPNATEAFIERWEVPADSFHLQWPL